VLALIFNEYPLRQPSLINKDAANEIGVYAEPSGLPCGQAVAPASTAVPEPISAIASPDRVGSYVVEIFEDQAGILWIGTLGKGVARYDGQSLTYLTTEDGLVGNGRDGYGITKYDGERFTHLTKQDGLHSNNITDLEQDQNGDIWISSRVAEMDHPDAASRKGPGGLNRLSNGKITSFPEAPGLSRNNVYFVGKDSSGNLWFPAMGLGVYRYDGEAFKLFDKVDREVPEATLAVQSMLLDSKGRHWFGASGGLYRLEGDVFVYVEREGPWG
jgi:ligand-binding sensor domain-containing protein